MYHQKKDYLLALIEILGRHIAQFVESRKTVDDLAVQQNLLKVCNEFYATNFNVYPKDSCEDILEKLPRVYFIEEFAKLLMYDYEFSADKNKDNLKKSLNLLEYVQNIDRVYSWERLALQQNILHLLEI